MDVIVTDIQGGQEWALTDLLGRSMGRIAKTPNNEFTVQPDGHALQTMAGMKHGPHATVDAALAEIEKHTRGVCHRNGEDQL